MNKVLTIATLLMLTTLGARAEQKVNIVVKPSAAAGTVTSTITGGTNGVGGICTLTVTPASGYYLTKDNLTATTSLDGSGVQARRRAEGIDVYSQTLTITATNPAADPSGTTTYTFTMPEDGYVNVDVTAEFQTLIAINPSVTLEGWTYGQTPSSQPVVTGNPGSGEETFTFKAEGATEFSETLPTNAGTHTVKATVAAAKQYAAGEATNTFTISKAEMSSVSIAAIDNQTYTGSALQPAVTVTFNDEELLTDEYEVSYENNVDVGEATVILTGKGNNFVAGSTTTTTFQIVAASLDNAIVEVDQTVTYTYTGSEVKPTVTVRLTADGNPLTQEDDYSVAYSNNIIPATADATLAPTVTVTGKGNYTGSKSVTFTITKGTPVVTIKGAENLIYNGGVQNLITSGETTGGKLLYSLKENEGYSETIPQGQNAGVYTVYYKVEGDDNYNGTDAQSVAVTIRPKEAKNPTIELSATSFVYDGQEHKPTVTVKDGQTTLTEDTDYTVAYQKDGEKATDFKAAGTYTVVISSVEGGNYVVSGSKTYEIVKSDEPIIVTPDKPDTPDSPVTPDKPGIPDNLTGKMQVYIFIRNVNPTSFSYNGNHQSPGYEVVYRFLPGESARAVMPDQDYRIKYKKNGKDVEGCIQPGTYTMTVYPSDNGAFTFDPQSVDFKIKYDGEIKEITDPETGKKCFVITGSGALEQNSSGGNIIVIPQTVPSVDNGDADIPIVGIGDGAFKDATQRTIIDLTGFDKVIKIGNNAVGDANVNVNKEQLADYAKVPNLEATLKNGRLFAWLSANYALTTFSCGIDVKISQHNPTVTIHNIRLPLRSVINDVTDYLQFYKCKVAQDWKTKNYEVVATNIIQQMKVQKSGKDSLLYKANNGIIVACDSASLIKLAKTADWSIIIDQVDWENVIKNLDLYSLPKDLGLEKEAETMGWNTLLGLATTDKDKISLVKTALNNYLSEDKNKAAIIKKVRSNAATLVAQYIDPNIKIATGDAKSYGEDNMLIPVTKIASYENDENFTYYALFNGQFKIIANNGNETPACKALLKVPTSMVKTGAAARALTITKGDGETTGIKTTDFRDYTDSDAWYTLSGQRIDEPTKAGLYIRNGKKVVVK